MQRRLDLPTARAAWWALLSLVQARRSLRRRQIDRVRLPLPPQLPPEAIRGVSAVLKRQRSTCLERSLVWQHWLAAQGDPRDLVVGVAGPAERFRAHAWLEGDPESSSAGFEELLRVPWADRRR